LENQLPPSQGPFDTVPTPPGGEPVAASGSFRRPADYYSAPVPPGGEKRGCPKWIPIGCGLGGCLVLIVLFVGGAIAVRDGSGRISRWFIDRLQKETISLVAADVPPEDRAALEREFATFRANLTAKKTSFVEMQPLLQTINDAIGDRKVTADEARSITRDLKSINDRAAEKPAPAPETN
jgi:hypothetical protein